MYTTTNFTFSKRSLKITKLRSCIISVKLSLTSDRDTSESSFAVGQEHVNSVDIYARDGQSNTLSIMRESRSLALSRLFLVSFSNQLLSEVLLPGGQYIRLLGTSHNTPRLAALEGAGDGAVMVASHQ